MNKNIVVVTRHEGALEWIMRHHQDLLNRAEVIFGRNVKIDDIRGKIVVGNIPLFLASEAEAVYAIEFAGTPPRGEEYTADDMEDAGAKLVLYKVVKL